MVDANRTFIVPGKLMERILTYFWSRPMVEVFDMFQELNAIVQTQVAADAAFPKSAQATPPKIMHRDQMAGDQ